MMGRFGQWGRIGLANTRGSSYKPPIESTISIFPSSRWPFHLWVSKGREPQRNHPARQHSLLPDVPSTSPSSPHQGDNSSHHGAVTTTERWTVSVWMQICGRAGSLQMQTRADRRAASAQFLSCWNTSVEDHCCFEKLSSLTTIAETKGCAMCFKPLHLIATWWIFHNPRQGKEMWGRRGVIWWLRSGDIWLNRQHNQALCSQSNH